MSAFLFVDQLRGRKNIVDEENGRKLGEIGLLEDVVTQVGVLQRSKSAMHSMVRIVKNAGSALAPGVNAIFDTDLYGTHVDGSPADDVAADGVVDPSLTSNVETGETFLLFVEGPCPVIVSAAVAGPYVVPSGSGKFKTALVSAAGRCGRTLEDGTGKSDTETMRVYLQCHSNF